MPRLSSSAKNVAAAMAALAVMLLVIGLSPRDSQAGGELQFEPGAVKCFEVLETPAECDGDTSPGAVSDLRMRFCVGWNEDCSMKDFPVTDSALGGLIDFIPLQFALATNGAVPIGAIGGRIAQEETLGLLSNPCSVTISESFTLLNASININSTIDPRPPGSFDVMETLAFDADGNGLPDGADRYPSFLNQYFGNVQPILRLFGISLIQGSWASVNLVILEPGTTLQFEGHVITPPQNLGLPAVLVANDPTVTGPPSPISDRCAPTNTDLVLLGQTLDNPCTPQSVAGASCPGVGIAFENRGYPLLPCEIGNSYDEDGDGVVNDGCAQLGANAESGDECENNLSDDPEDSLVNDGCPQVGDVSEGQRIPGECAGEDEGGCVLVQNPADEGTVDGTVLASSGRDADGDGIENRLDVCALIPNSSWDPRNIDAVNDADIDGLPTECDPNPNQPSPFSPFGCPAGVVGSDEDQDCYSNRHDNCPLVNQLEDPSQPPGPANRPMPTDSDGDDLGDACDPHPNDADAEGEIIFVCLRFEIEIGGAGGPAVGVPTDQCDFTLAVGLKGDVNCDGGINSTDALEILQSVVGGFANTAIGLPPPCEASQDMDCDNDNDAIDALRILQHIAALPTNIPGACLPIGSPVV